LDSTEISRAQREKSLVTKKCNAKKCKKNASCSFSFPPAATQSSEGAPPPAVYPAGSYTHYQRNPRKTTWPRGAWAYLLACHTQVSIESKIVPLDRGGLPLYPCPLTKQKKEIKKGGKEKKVTVRPTRGRWTNQRFNEFSWRQF
jgi:hypothetical protein